MTELELARFSGKTVGSLMAIIQAMNVFDWAIVVVAIAGVIITYIGMRIPTSRFR